MSKPKWEKAHKWTEAAHLYSRSLELSAQEQWSAPKLIEHMETFLEKKAADSESEVRWLRHRES